MQITCLWSLCWVSFSWGAYVRLGRYREDLRAARKTFTTSWISFTVERWHLSIAPIALLFRLSAPGNPCSPRSFPFSQRKEMAQLVKIDLPLFFGGLFRLTSKQIANNGNNTQYYCAIIQNKDYSYSMHCKNSVVCINHNTIYPDWQQMLNLIHQCLSQKAFLDRLLQII